MPALMPALMHKDPPPKNETSNLGTRCSAFQAKNIHFIVLQWSLTCKTASNGAKSVAIQRNNKDRNINTCHMCVCVCVCVCVANMHPQDNQVWQMCRKYIQQCLNTPKKKHVNWSMLIMSHQNAKAFKTIQQTVRRQLWHIWANKQRQRTMNACSQPTISTTGHSGEE